MTLKQKLDAMFKSYNTLFNRGLSNAKTYWQEIAMSVPSSGSEEVYAWLADMPMMREWIGERAIKELSEKGYSIRNKDFELTVSVPKKTVDDDQYGIYAPAMERMGEAAIQWPDELVFSLLPSGFTADCYDGKSFFNTAHPVGKGVCSNRSNKPLSVANYSEARSAMMSYTNDKGVPLNIVPNLLVVPPQLEETARRIIKSDLIEIGGVTQSNPWKDSAEILVVPRLAGKPKQWFLLQTNGILRPLIWQIREEPNFQALINPESENVFMRNNFIYGTSSRGNAGYGFWQQAYGSTGE